MSRVRVSVLAIASAVGVAALFALATPIVGDLIAVYFFLLFAQLALVAALAYLAWRSDPVYLLCGALFLSPLAGNWEQIHVPGFVAPDRMLAAAAIAVAVLRGPAVRWRPSIRIAPAHVLMFIALAYVVVSALMAGTLTDRPAFFKLFDTFGVLPFMVFLVAPVVFREQRQRDALLKTFVVLGAYLGLTTFFEYVHFDTLVFPKYILDPNYGIHHGRGRGPFVEAVTNGYAQYVCGVVSVIAWNRWRGQRPWGRLAPASAVLCAVGAFLCLQRSVWVGAVAGTLVAMLAISETRRYLPATAIVGTAAIVLSLAFIPGLGNTVSSRAGQKGPIYDRQNLAKTSQNMIEARPLAGFGWNQFKTYERDYVEQSPDYPLTAVSRTNVHSIVLNYAVELGLVGVLLWVGVCALGIGGSLATRVSRELRPWRIGLLGVAVCFVIVTNFVPPSYFPNLSVWLLAGVVWSGRYVTRDAAAGSSRAHP
jgi:putative inorganic carbon (hco3(-)) transporter